MRVAMVVRCKQHQSTGGALGLVDTNRVVSTQFRDGHDGYKTEASIGY